MSRPLLQSQLEAATHIYRSCMKTWRATNEALGLLHDRLPGFSLEVTLLKVAAINQLYATHVYAVTTMAKHVVDIMRDRPAEPAEVVARIANLGKGRKHWSFASKFAHFFVDPQHFCPFDQYAKAAVKYHLGEDAAADEANRYTAFADNVERLRARNGLSCEPEELDRYLWLAGVFRAFRAPRSAGKQPQINAEALALFKSPCPAAQEALRRLLPADDSGE